MLYLGCICSFGLGSLAGLNGIALHLWSPPHPDSGVVLLSWSVVFIKTGLVFGVVDKFLKSTAPLKAKVAVLKVLLAALPNLGGLFGGNEPAPHATEDQDGQV